MVEVSNYFVKCIAVYIPGKQVYIKIKVKTNIANRYVTKHDIENKILS